MAFLCGAPACIVDAGPVRVRRLRVALHLSLRISLSYSRTFSDSIALVFLSHSPFLPSRSLSVFFTIRVGDGRHLYVYYYCAAAMFGVGSTGVGRPKAYLVHDISHSLDIT